MGNAELWKRPAWADNDHRTRSLTQQIQEHPGFWSILAMSQKMEHQPIPLREKAHEIFATAKSVAAKAEAEIILVSRVDEYLRFGNNELAQSQYSTSRNLSVRIASEKKQGRVTTGTLDKASIEKTVEKAISQARNSPEDPDYLPMPGPQKYRSVDRYSEKTVEAPAELKAGYIGSAMDLAKKNHLLASGVLGTSIEHVMMLNTSGLEASYRGTGGYFSLTMDADNGNQTGFALSTFGDIDELDPNKVSQTVLERAKLNKNQADIAPGKFDIVVDPYAWSEMLLFFAVSASTGYSPDLGMRQYKEGRSYLSGRLGERFSEITSASMMTCIIQTRPGLPSMGKVARRAKLRLSRTGSFETWSPPEYLSTAMVQHQQVTSYLCQTLWVSCRPI